MDARARVWGSLALIVSLAAITRQSLWIDEALTAAKASQPNLYGWWHAMLADKASDLQMPLYMIYMWGFAKVFGISEWALRAANIPWFISGVAVLIKSLEEQWIQAAPAKFRKGLSIEQWLAYFAAALICPFAWYYLDEARPYAMQLGASLIIFAALLRFSGLEAAGKMPGWFAAFLFGIIALSGSSLLGMIWAGAACAALAAIVSLKGLMELAKAHFAMFLSASICLLALAVYYLWTIKIGARASDVGTTNALNVFFIAYELLGFSGLGPGRLQIRDEGMRAFIRFIIPLAVYGILLAVVMIAGLRKVFRHASRKAVVLCLVIATSAILILLAGRIDHFRVLGRHFMPLLPVVIYILWVGLDACCGARKRLLKCAAWAFAIMAVASCLSFRFAGRHAKDDYRDAAAFAQAELHWGKKVWWNAGREGAVYYGLPLQEQMPGGGAIWLMNPISERLGQLDAPDTIIVSKPDVYDGNGAVAEYLRKNGYASSIRWQAFAVWQRAGKSS